jgi:hypothetical protein
MSDPESRLPRPSSRRVGSWEPGFIAAAYFLAHLPFLAPALEDIDSINFALGLRDFNPAEHQPHPPGYPVYIALGRVSLAAVHAFTSLGRVQAEALALAFLSALGGAIAIVCASVVFTVVAADSSVDASRSTRLVRWATVLLAVCPLFWMTGARPMSDMPGLAFALAAQALALTGRLHAATFVAAFALGVRAQSVWLTAPLLGWALVRSRVRTWREWLRIVLIAAAGVLAWAIPLVVASGGPGAYGAALGTQAGEDFAFVDMVWTNPTPRRLALGLIHTFVMPWASVPLAGVMLALAAAGALVSLFRGPVLRLAIAFGPYAVFHLVFQETITVRYALPLVAPVAFLAASALAATGRVVNFVAAPMAALSLVVAFPGLMAYGRDPHPAFRAIEDVERRAESEPPAIVTSHFELRRALRAADPTRLPLAWAPRGREWLELVSYWRDGGRRPAWFLANARRTDLALIDPRSRTQVVRYRWAVEDRPELSGTRPSGTDWYRLNPPGWFLGEGWSLTAETGGVAEATRTAPGYQPILGYARRRSEPMHLVVGGRHLGEIADGAALFELVIDEQVRDRWTLSPEERNFLRFLDLPGGLPGPGDYAVITVSSLPAIRGTVPRRVPVAVRQFDIQPATQVIFGFGQGWHEDEYDAVTGRRWRWTSARAVLAVRGPGEPVRVRVRGESPLRYFDEAPTVTVSAAGRVFARLQPSADFDLDATVPADAVRAAGGDIVLETTRSFVPAENGSADTRRLGLRIFQVHVERAR